MILQPAATLVEGAPGSGKTDVTATYIEAGIETFVIMTEPGGVESLLDSCERRKLPIDKLHYTSVLPAAAGWSALTDMINVIGTTGFDDIAKIKSGVGKAETRKPAMKFLEALKDFKCERDGKSYGDMSTWDHSRAMVWDSLSGISIMSMALTIGYKPSAHQGEWGVAMNFIEQLLLKGTSDRKCFFTLTAHVEKELNEITGGTQVMASTLGRKLAPKIPRFFSEVVYAKRKMVEGKPKFTWATVDTNADLKNRSLPISDDLIPSYVPIVQAFRRRLNLAGATSPVPPAATPAKETTASAVRPPIAPMRPQATQPAAKPQGA